MAPTESGSCVHDINNLEVRRSAQIHGNTTHVFQNPIYPTRSLNFLKPSSAPSTRAAIPVFEHVNTPSNLGTESKTGQSEVRLQVLIVGAGLGGLATAVALARSGHTVQVLEQAAALGEVGAGIQVPSNSSRILLDWGIEPFFGDKVVEPDGITFRRWQDGNAIGFTKLIPDFRSTYRAPYYVIHRAHFHRALHELSEKHGVESRLGAKVVAYDEHDPSVTLADGTVLKADLVVAADGRSPCMIAHLRPLIISQGSSRLLEEAFLAKKQWSQYIMALLHTERPLTSRR